MYSTVNNEVNCHYDIWKKELDAYSMSSHYTLFAPSTAAASAVYPLVLHTEHEMINVGLASDVKQNYHYTATTSYKGNKQSIGVFWCECGRTWQSSLCYANKGQPCIKKICQKWNSPYKMFKLDETKAAEEYIGRLKSGTIRRYRMRDDR